MTTRKWALVFEFDGYYWVRILVHWKDDAYEWKVKRFWKIRRLGY
jgi:hypothetical protein